MMATKALQMTIPMHCSIIVGGVGFGGLLAHELALHLEGLKSNVRALALFEGCYVIKDSSRVFQMLPAQAAMDTCQVALALYPLIINAMGPERGALDDFVQHVAQKRSFDEQLDYVASFKPESLSVYEWDLRVHAALSRLVYYRSVSESYSPVDYFHGRSIVFSTLHRARATNNRMSTGGHIINCPHNAWERIWSPAQRIQLDCLNLKHKEAAAILEQTILEESRDEALDKLETSGANGG
mmetsp:Transcript_4707/g.9392  ORF Transcript_4707/g.9392 Transcript_4707/m.9392 type:complete len:240 (+) Transcript_4707:2-721(+)